MTTLSISPPDHVETNYSQDNDNYARHQLKQSGKLRRDSWLYLPTLAVLTIYRSNELDKTEFHLWLGRDPPLDIYKGDATTYSPDTHEIISELRLEVVEA